MSTSRAGGAPHRIRCSLLLPIRAELSVEALAAAVDVLVRTAPAELDLDLLVARQDAADGVDTLLAAMDGDVEVVDGDVAAAAAVSDADVVVVLDAAARPDLAELPTLIARLDRGDDALPFVHRLGLLLTRREALAALVLDGTTPPLPVLAGRLRPVPVAPPSRPSLSAPAGAPAPRAGAPATVVLLADAPLAELEGCLVHLRRFLPTGMPLIVVDPGGDYRRSRALREQRSTTVVAGSGTHPWAAGVLRADTEVVVLLEAAAWITRRCLDEMLEGFADPGVVAVGPRTNLALGDQQRGVRYRDVDAMHAFAEQVRRDVPRGPAAYTTVGALSGVCLAVRRAALVGVGGHDDNFTDGELAGLDLCLRLAATGGRLVVADRAFVHVAALSRGTRAGRWRLGGGGELGLLRARHGQDADRNLPGLVGAVMIVKDEEEKLARALESVSGVVDDVVICDTGSSDGTGDLIDALGARRTFFAWIEDFAAARNAALAEHSGTWGLLLDADETLECPDVPIWRRTIAEDPADVVLLVCRNLDSGTGGATVDNASSRLIRAADCHWAGRIHEQMVRRDGKALVNGGNDGARIIHDGYSVARIVDRGKAGRNATLTQLELDDSTDQVAVDPGRARFERGRAELLAGDVDAAEGHFRAALELLPKHSEMLRRMAWCNLAVIANDNSRWTEAIEFGTCALGEDAAYTQAAVAIAIARLQLDRPGDREAAREMLAATVAAGQQLDDPTITRLVLSLRDEGLLVGDAVMLLGGLLLEVGDVDATAELLLPIARSHPSVFKAWTVLATALRKQRPDWADVLAEVAEPVPAAVEPLLGTLAPDDRAALLAALRARSVEEWQVSEDDRVWRSMQPELRRMSRAGVVAAARQHEASSPALALRLWRFAGDDAASRVGQARCLDALGCPDDAADALADVDPSDLDAADTLFVAALAAGFGDAGLAGALLDGLPDDLDPALAEPAAQLRELLGSVVA